MYTVYIYAHQIILLFIWIIKCLIKNNLLNSFTLTDTNPMSNYLFWTLTALLSQCGVKERLNKKKFESHLEQDVEDVE